MWILPEDVLLRNFLRIAESIDTMPLLAALAVRPDLWNANDLRTKYQESPHCEADDIWLWFNKMPDNPADVIDDIQTHPYPAWTQLPVKDMVLNLMRAVGGTQLGRVLITRLAPGHEIYPHADEGAPATFYSRYQIMLQCNPGVLFLCGDETVQMKTGDVYWFDNRQTHSVLNNSADDRLALIVDVRTC